MLRTRYKGCIDNAADAAAQEIDMTDVNTESELMAAAATALVQRDSETLENLAREAEDWLEDETTKAARRSMLSAMTEAAMLLVDEPSELA